MPGLEGRAGAAQGRVCPSSTRSPRLLFSLLIHPHDPFCPLPRPPPSLSFHPLGGSSEAASPPLAPPPAAVNPEISGVWLRGPEGLEDRGCSRCVYSFRPFLPRGAGPPVAGVSVTPPTLPWAPGAVSAGCPAAVSWLTLQVMPWNQLAFNLKNGFLLHLSASQLSSNK